MYYVFVVFCRWDCQPQNNDKASPHTPPAPPTHPLSFPLLLPTNTGWLLVSIVKRQPPKAKALLLSHFFLFVAQLCVCILASGYGGVPVKHVIPIASDPP
jgi:hypothetical protein